MKIMTLAFALFAVAPALSAQTRSGDYTYRSAVEDDRRPRDVRSSCGSCSRGRCAEAEWKEIRRCEDRSREIERKDAEWRADARKRRIDFERDMNKREREFRKHEQERWERHQREIARRWGDARR